MSPAAAQGTDCCLLLQTEPLALSGYWLLPSSANAGEGPRCLQKGDKLMRERPVLFLSNGQCHTVSHSRRSRLPIGHSAIAARSCQMPPPELAVSSFRLGSRVDGGTTGRDTDRATRLTRAPASAGRKRVARRVFTFPYVHPAALQQSVKRESHHCLPNFFPKALALSGGLWRTHSCINIFKLL